jgi:hypothetical protein
MKTLILIILPLAVILLLFINSSYSQQDSVKNIALLETKSDNGLYKTYYVEDCEFSYFDSVTFTKSVSGIKSRQLSEISFDNVSKITFKKYNYLELLNKSGNSLSVDLKKASEVKIKKGSYWLLGGGMGCLAGTLIGLGIGAVIDNNQLSNHSVNSVNLDTEATGFYFHPMGGFEFGKPIGAGVGFIVGAVIGAIIGTQIDKTETINLKDKRDVDREIKLKDFLRNNSNF